MHERSRLPEIRRRDLLRILTAGTAVVAGAALPRPVEAAAETTTERVRPRYQANSPAVQAFYRVNRYPAK
jgi:hypothetical protein